jgi:hypothetical protein
VKFAFGRTSVGEFRTMRAVAIIVALAFADVANAASNAQPRRLKACVVWLNEPHEMEVFRAQLDPKRFELIDLRAKATAARPDSPAAAGGSGTGWLMDACSPETTCDVMIYSAEFAGRFFGKQGPSLSLQEMEEASCNPKCAGLFRKPMEVFLMACNTLATKDEDNRTPEQYLQVLLEHGFDRASAERVVELRYGPLGPSFREALRRVFAGVPRIYGFSSVAPRGEYTAPMLKRYFRGQGDYASTLLRNVNSTGRNQALLSSFKGTSMTQTIGLTAKEPGAIDRKHICALYDEQLSVAERLRISYGLLTGPEALRFVPTLEVFLSRHPREKFNRQERSIFTEIQSLDATREEVMKLVRELNVSALKLELAHFAMLVGWLERSEFHALAVDGARQLLRQPLSAESVDIMCAITQHESLSADFTADDIPERVFTNGQGLRLLSCLAPSDPRMSGRILAGVRSSDPLTRQWAVYNLTQRRPLDERVLEQLVPNLRDPAPEVSTRVEWLFQAHAPLPKRVQRTMQLADQLQKLPQTTTVAGDDVERECRARTETCELIGFRPGS